MRENNQGAKKARHPAETYLADAPLWHKIRLRVFGAKHVPDGQVCIIYRGESYSDVRGPGYFGVCKLLERMGEVVKISPRTGHFTFENLSTREPVPLTLTGLFNFKFDPRPPTDPKIAVNLVKLSPGALEGFMQDTLRRLVRVYTPQYSFVELRSATPFPTIENAVVNDFAREELLQRMGLQLSRFEIQHGITPERTEARLQESAQRMRNADSIQQLPLHELLLALYTELVEKSSGGSEQLWNMTDLMNLIQRLDKGASPPTRIIDATPSAPPPTPNPPSASSETKPTSESDETKPASKSDETKSASDETKPDDDAPPKRSSSYLDPDF